MIATTTPSPVVRSHANGARVAVRDAATSARRSFSKPLLPLMPPLATTVMSLVAPGTRASVRIAARAGGGVDASRPRRYASHQIALGRLRRLDRADADRLERLLEDVLRLTGGSLNLGGSVDDRDEGLDDHRVELRTGVGAKLAERRLAGDRGSIGPVGGHGRERVGDGDDLRLERDLVLAKPARIAGAIEALVVREDDRAHGLEHPHAREKVRAAGSVGPPLGPVALAEP